jgi:hypothetical protein
MELEGSLEDSKETITGSYSEQGTFLDLEDSCDWRIQNDIVP